MTGILDYDVVFTTFNQTIVTIDAILYKDVYPYILSGKDDLLVDEVYKCSTNIDNDLKKPASSNILWSLRSTIDDLMDNQLLNGSYEEIQSNYAVNIRTSESYYGRSRDTFYLLAYEELRNELVCIKNFLKDDQKITGAVEYDTEL